MDLYDVVITPDAMAMLTNLVDYILYVKQNPGAADAVYRDALETAEQLEAIAGSLTFCNKQILANRGYRKILFRRHDYLLLYKIYGKTAVVEGVFHKNEDYENKFAKKQSIK